MNGTAHIRLTLIKTKPPPRRPAVRISSRVAPTAVLRNRLRRRVAAILSTLAIQSNDRQIVVTIITPTLPKPKDLFQEITALLRKSGMLTQ